VKKRHFPLPQVWYSLRTILRLLASLIHASPCRLFKPLSVGVTFSALRKRDVLPLTTTKTPFQRALQAHRTRLYRWYCVDEREHLPVAGCVGLTAFPCLLLVSATAGHTFHAPKLLLTPAAFSSSMPVFWFYPI